MTDVKVGDVVVINPDVLPRDFISSDHWIGIIADTAMSEEVMTHSFKAPVLRYCVEWLYAPRMNWKSTMCRGRELRLYEAMRK